MQCRILFNKKRRKRQATGLGPLCHKSHP